MAACFCDVIPTIDNATNVVILQHTRERFHAFNTARIAARALQNSTLLHGYPSDFRDRPDPLNEHAVLVYPGSTARDLASIPSADLPRQLVILDGTWHHTKGILRDTDWLSALPRVSIRPAEPGRYRIRREPDAVSLSTVEAVVQALNAIEPETSGLDALMNAFEVMIDRQLAVFPRQPDPRHRKRAAVGVATNTPNRLLAAPDSLVVASAESARFERNGPAELVSWQAQRFGTERRFRAFIQPPRMPASDVLAYMGLTAADFDDAWPRTRFCQEWESYLQPHDTLVVFGKQAPQLLERVGAVVPEVVLLRSLDFRVGRRASTAAALLDQLELEAPAAAEPARADRRLAELLELVRYVREGTKQ